jgi:hypothetical protein
MSATWRALAALVNVILLAGPVFSHHSFAAEYDQNKFVKLTGTVTKIEWENPHTFLYVDITDKKTGKVTNWAFELGSPSNLTRRGWTKDTAKIGMVVTVEGAQAKNGSSRGNARNVTINGKKMPTASSQELQSYPGLDFNQQINDSLSPQ